MVEAYFGPGKKVNLDPVFVARRFDGVIEGVDRYASEVRVMLAEGWIDMPLK